MATFTPQRIEICGGIAAGKTTLCNLLGRVGWLPINENFSSNPFWTLFCQNPSVYAFETELTFLLQHYGQVRLYRPAERNIVCDFAFLQDHAYAEVNLRADQLAAFRAVHAYIVSELRSPRLIVHLKCSAEEELARIRRRGRQEENSIDIVYLRALNDAICRHIDSPAQSTRILTIDSEHENFAGQPETQDRVLRLIAFELSGLENVELENHPAYKRP